MRIGIIGTGSMGRNHMRVVESIPELELTCAVDISKANLDEASSGYNVQTFSNHEKIADLVDAVMVSTPTTYHYPITKFFIEKGKDVLVEKPFTSTLDQSDELIELAKKKGVTIAVGHLERFNPAVEYIQSHVQKPLFIEIQRLGSFSPRSLDVDVINDLMIHDLDIILQWDKSGIQQIDASGIPVISKKVDIANARIQFKSGLVANITASRISQKKTRKLRVFQKNGYFSVDYKKKRVKIYRIDGTEIIEDVPVIEDVEPLFNLWNNFYKTISTGKNHNVTGEDGRNALELAEKVSNSIKNIEV
ncbi:MAG: Gfo/Idh/MocA family oxidoreductase [Candidatus Aminicenantes bacterium]|nr:Gfo/Idh/MocA family oxidoreductase [Candidatus Aminicenantes bacterium]